MQELQKRYRSGLLGVAVGDALGATLEFMSREEIERRYGTLREIVGGGWLRLAPGEVTDDTEMTLAVAEGILEDPDDPIDSIGEGFIAWYEKRPKDIGRTCQLAIESALSFSIGSKPNWGAASTAVREHLGEQAAGNGALMRTLPVALAYYGDDHRVDSMSARVAEMTHPTRDAAWSCSLYSLLVCRLLDGIDKEEALRWVYEWTRYQDAPPLFKPPGTVDAPHGSVSGYTVDTLQAALWAFQTGVDAEDVIVRAANLGGDTDTVAAIAGGLAGVYYVQIPERWVNAIEPSVRQHIEELADGLCALADHAAGDRPHPVRMRGQL